MDLSSFQVWASSKQFNISIPVVDGAVHRFRRGSHTRDNCWYIIFESGVGMVGDWATGETYTYSPTGNGNGFELGDEQKAEIKARRAEFEKWRDRERDTAAAESERIWAMAQTVKTNCPYLKSKKLGGLYGARTELPVEGRRHVLVPMMDPSSGRIRGLQRIFPDGNKRFLAGQQTRGLVFKIPASADVKEPGTVYLAEGYATAVTVHEATGGEVWAALSAMNLPDAARAMCQAFPSSRRVLAGDIDESGMKYAEMCDGFQPIYPKFRSSAENPTDFNDLAYYEGLAVVTEQLTKTGAKQPPADAGPGKREPLARKYNRITAAINSGETGDRFYVVEPEKGKRRVIWDRGSGVVCYCSDHAVVAAILTFTKDNHTFELTPSNAFEAMRHWLFTTPPIPEPPIIRMRSDAGLCFHRLPFDPEPHSFGKHPRFDEFLSRVSNREALIDWIGSLFNLRSDRQQYVWLYGEGNNGKGAFIRFLEKCFGPSYAATETPAKDDKFWNFGLLGKRLIGFPDCNNDKFPTSQKFKMLTGDDQIPMEAKGKQAFSAKINCKFIFASNNKPSISSQISDRRRAIYCEVDPIPGAVDPRYEMLLWDEAKYVIGTCIEEYKKRYPNNGPIKTDDVLLEEVINESEIEMEFVFNKHFILDRRPVPEKDKFKFTGSDLSEVIKITGVNKKDFIKFMRSRYDIRYKTVRICNPNSEKTVQMCYVGAQTVFDFNAQILRSR